MVPQTVRALAEATGKATGCCRCRSTRDLSLMVLLLLLLSRLLILAKRCSEVRCLLEHWFTRCRLRVIERDISHEGWESILV